MESPQQEESLFTKYLSIGVQTVKNFKNISVLPFIEEIVTFTSIILAYEYVSFTYDNDRLVQKWMKIQFDSQKTLSTLLLVFALYLIVLKVVLRFVVKYGAKPKSKQQSIPIQQKQSSQKQSIPQAPKQTETTSSYADIISKLVQNSIYGLVFVSLITAYAIKSPFNKGNQELLKIQQINFMMFWYVAANIFYGFGSIFGKMFKINTLNVFGLSIGVIVIFMELGLAHGLNMFIFI